MKGFDWMAVLLGGALVTATLVTGGCAATSPGVARTAALTETPARVSLPQWHYVRFRFARGPDGEVNRFLDGLVADSVVRPPLEEYENDLVLWRFHRRWAGDATGHQFSFIFLAPADTFSALVSKIGASPLLRRLRADGHLIDFRVDAPDGESASDPAATSDPSWSPDVQREWPKFMMGASGTWLGLTASAAAGQPAALSLYERYRAADEIVDELWFGQGSHAFLHHLNALFGYQPVRVIRREITTF